MQETSKPYAIISSINSPNLQNDKLESEIINMQTSQFLECIIVGRPQHDNKSEWGYAIDISSEAYCALPNQQTSFFQKNFKAILFN